MEGGQDSESEFRYIDPDSAAIYPPLSPWLSSLFSTSLFVKRKLLSVWAPVWARESQGVCRRCGNPQPGWRGWWGLRKEVRTWWGGGAFCPLWLSKCKTKEVEWNNFMLNWLHIVCAEFVFLQGSHLKVSEGLFHVLPPSLLAISIIIAILFMHFYLLLSSFLLLFSVFISFYFLFGRWGDRHIPSSVMSLLLLSSNLILWSTPHFFFNLTSH